ncbi:putative retrotransposable element Tf2 protein type 1-like protein [Phytophthora infestans]|uniref:Putative retrotransposable element Tf2 protein type 1-like protein n=1 Tax=Phytophthora infestans TaxID=4787 RepID=A0A8S9U4U0_PHYIN|nr:putative retrotransposable element Tf2 protein type 1-like protein [Phytophthora infestans]
MTAIVLTTSLLPVINFFLIRLTSTCLILAFFGKRKLAPRYIGPYPVLKLTTPDTYQVQLPPGIKLHNEFHISYLRPYEFNANPRRLNDVPRLLTRDGHEGF